MFPRTHVKIIIKYELFNNNSSFMRLSIKGST